MQITINSQKAACAYLLLSLSLLTFSHDQLIFLCKVILTVSSNRLPCIQHPLYTPNVKIYFLLVQMQGLVRLFYIKKSLVINLFIYIMNNRVERWSKWIHEIKPLQIHCTVLCIVSCYRNNSWYYLSIKVDMLNSIQIKRQNIYL